MYSILQSSRFNLIRFNWKEINTVKLALSSVCVICIRNNLLVMYLKNILNRIQIWKEMNDNNCNNLDASLIAISCINQYTKRFSNFNTVRIYWRFWNNQIRVFTVYRGKFITGDFYDVVRLARRFLNIPYTILIWRVREFLKINLPISLTS